MITVSAPGKLILFGEHAVVYNRPCIVTTINKRLYVTLKKRFDKKIILDAPQLRVFDYSVPLKNLGKKTKKEAKFVLAAVKNFFAKYNLKSGLQIKTESEFSPKFGFGSSSAVIVCTLKALSKLFKIELNRQELFNLAYQTLIDVQKVGSGFDVAAAIYGGPLYFLTGGRTIEKMKVNKIPLIVGYTKIKSETKKIVESVGKELKKNPKKINKIFDLIEKIVNKAKRKIEEKNWEEVGKLMNDNQKLLRELGVSSKKLENLIKASLKAGAFGAKLSGAGKGDCMIAVVEPEKRKNVKKAIEKAGGEVIDLEFGAEGIRLE